jgi:hypothetical protein
MAVFRARLPSGAGFAGFRCAGGLGSLRADVPESPADARWGQLAGRGGAFPGPAIESHAVKPRIDLPPDNPHIADVVLRTRRR